MISIGPSSAVSIDSLHISGVTVRKSPFGSGGLMVMAKMSGSGHAENNLARPSSVDESATIGVTIFPYFSVISLAAFSSLSSRRADMYNSTPASAKRSAVALPIPALPPAINAFFPAIFKSTVFFLLYFDFRLSIFLR